MQAIKVEESDINSSAMLDVEAISEDAINLCPVKQILQVNDIEQLEAAAKLAVEFSMDLRMPVWGADNKQEARLWNQKFMNLKDMHSKHHAVIGVVGNTGAGKSSLINAILGVPDLIPTSGIEACTAVATEIMRNDTDPDDPTSAYRAKIILITKNAWGKEIDTMLSDLRADDGTLSRAYEDKDTEAGIAYAKIKAVYPQKARTKDLISKLTKDDLLGDPEVLKHLDSEIELRACACEELKLQVQEFLESAETPARRTGRKKKPIALWPLIEVVRIYIRLEALSTGTTIVDLPGVQDQNAARAAVARRYMMNCNSLCIATPIQRAVDDSTARNLLSDSLKIQLPMDGLDAHATVVCTKVDDISVSEICDGLGLHEHVETIERQKQSLRAQIQTKMEFCEAHELAWKRINTACDQVTLDLQRWEGLRAQAQQGITVFIPKSTTPKRKRPFIIGERLKPAAREGDGDGDAEPEMVPLDSSIDREQPIPLQQIENHLVALETFQNSREQEIGRIDSEYINLQDEIVGLEMSLKQLPTAKSYCIQARNKRSKEKIAENFLANMDHEADEGIEDGAEAGRAIPHTTIPVFCVSSRAYQAIKGDINEDDQSLSEAFPTIEDTGIPMLQAHARQSNLTMRTAICHHILNDFQSHVSGLWLWSGGRGSGVHMTENEKNAETDAIFRDIERLHESIQCYRLHILSRWDRLIDKVIIGKLCLAAAKASDAVMGIFSRWTMRCKEGGLVAQSFRAICRRGGGGRYARKDFNHELAEPLMRQIARDWARIFTKELPKLLAQFDEYAKAQSEELQVRFRSTRGYKGHSGAAQIMLDQQMRGHMRRLSSVGEDFKVQLQDAQRMAGRSMETVIQEGLADIYELCAQEGGTGMYIRMKEIMRNALEERKTLICM